MLYKLEYIFTKKNEIKDMILTTDWNSAKQIFNSLALIYGFLEEDIVFNEEKHTGIADNNKTKPIKLKITEE